MSMSLQSKAFGNGQPIPEQYSCMGADISPDLHWEGAPESTAGFVLICDDPDAPVGVWDHWILYDLPPDASPLAENVATLPTGTLVGKNSWGKQEYGGPCPPSGTHRYFFRVYALDRLLQLPPGADKQTVLKAMEGHVLDQAELMGTFSKR